MSEARTPFFDRDFTQARRGPTPEPQRRLPVPFAEHMRLIDEARREGRLAGIEEGKREQADQERIRLANALEMVTERLRIAAADLRRIEDTARHEATEFAMIFARKLAGRMVETAPVEAIAATARAIFSDIRGTPHVAIRVAGDLVDPCKNRIVELMRENGIEAKLFVFPDPDIASGDCRIEWAEGGIVRDQARIQTLLERSVALLFPTPQAAE